MSVLSGKPQDYPLGNESNAAKDYFLNFFLLNRPLGTPDVLSPTWSLFVEVIFYSLTAIFMTSTRRNPIKATLYMLGILTGLVLVSSFHQILKNIADLTVYIFFILIGRVVYFWTKQRISPKQAIFLGIAFFLSFILLYDYLLPNRMFSKPVLLIVSDLVALTIFFIAMATVNKRLRIISFLADISYAVYLVHIPVGSLVLNILDKYGVAFELGLTTAIILTIVVSYFINQFIEIPAQKFARQFSTTKLHFVASRSVK